MKRKVRYSKYCVITTIVCFTALGVPAVYAFYDGPMMVCLPIVAIILGIGIAGAYFSPLHITLTHSCLELVMLARRKTIPYSEIKSVKICKPTMGAIRICGSGGCFGYWGWFRESDIGKYFAYYGRASDCFLLTLKNGRKYMLGCTDAPQTVICINSHLD